MAEIKLSLQDNPPLPNSSDSEILPNKTPDYLDPLIPEEAILYKVTPVCDVGTQTTCYYSDVVPNKIERRIRNNDSKTVETSLKNTNLASPADFCSVFYLKYLFILAIKEDLSTGCMSIDIMSVIVHIS
ncbi:hypothetical protein CHS0354_029066 [Potamilus streckersoni]|uniref:Uncharacterized protein n=1 Tax=Potamilus streckersoni TaxID=2493646 RepID=A0AAE0SRN9_9BIVA|nr:hypothetical protein CHS0354_029066 [Potamilus streckersoni]